MTAVTVPVARPFGWAPIDILNTWDLGTDRRLLVWATGWYVARDAPQLVDLIDEHWPPREPVNAVNPGGRYASATNRLPGGKRRVEWGDFGFNVEHTDTGKLVAAVFPAELWALISELDLTMLDRLRSATAGLELAQAGYTAVKRRTADGVHWDETGRDELDEACDLVTDLAAEAWRSIDPAAEAEPVAPPAAPRHREPADLLELLAAGVP